VRNTLWSDKIGFAKTAARLIFASKSKAALSKPNFRKASFKKRNLKSEIRCKMNRFQNPVGFDTVL
jgi:hypothetical protein